MDYDVSESEHKIISVLRLNCSGATKIISTDVFNYSVVATHN